MRIKRVRISNYRSIAEQSIDFETYTAFIGANGSGKSSVLYALDWFFNGDACGCPPSVDDLHRDLSGAAARELSIEVTFSELDADDRKLLGKYGRGDVAIFRRTWSEQATKLVGNSRQGPGFAAVRMPQLSAAEMKRLYNDLPDDLGLPKASTKGDIAAALDAWEIDEANHGKLEQVNDSEVPAAWGFDAGRLQDRIEFVLVPASVQLSDHIGGNADKNSAMQRLLKVLNAKEIEAIKAAWSTKYQAEVDELNVAVRNSLSGDAATQETRINKVLAAYVPGTSVRLVPEPVSVAVTGKGDIRTKVSFGGRESDAEYQGHGIQRALMIAVLSAASGTFDQDGERTGGPRVVLGIEEPEIYQHPSRARHFAASLHRLAGTHFQVAVATHSPYFVRPAWFSSMRRCRLLNGTCDIMAATVADVAHIAGVDASKVQAAIDRKLPERFAEGFFADVAVLVEGQSDQATLEVVFDRLEHGFDRGGVAVLAVGGKEELWISRALLVAIGGTAYLVGDGDFDPRLDDAEQNGGHRASTKKLLERLNTLGPVGIRGGVATDFGDPTSVTSDWTLWQHDIEAELSTWASFMSAIEASGGRLRDKRAATYREAVVGSSTEDMPAELAALVSAIGTAQGLVVEPVVGSVPPVAHEA